MPQNPRSGPKKSSKTRTRKESFSETLKAALWEAYGRKCAYTGVPLKSPGDVEVDHILPEWLADDPSELKLALEQYGLGDDFHIRGNWKNLAPSSSTFNKLKRGKTRPGETVSNYARKWIKYLPEAEQGQVWSKGVSEVIAAMLRVAQQKYEVVRALEARNAVAEKLVAARVTIEATKKAKLSADDLDYIHDEVCGDAREYADAENMMADRITISRRYAKLELRLPVFPDLQGSARIQLRSLRVRDASVHLDHRDVVSILLEHTGTPPGARRFVRPGGGVVEFRGTVLDVSSSAIEDLIYVVDAAAPHYVNPILHAERELFRSTRFPYANRGYRLWKVSLNLWRAILRFAHQHQHREGTSPHHIFDARNSSFGIICGHPKEPNPAPRAVLHAEWDEFALPPAERSPSQQDVWICWEPGAGLGEGLAVAERYRTGVTWNAEDASTWLDECLLPWIVEWANDRHQPESERSLLSRLRPSKAKNREPLTLEILRKSECVQSARKCESEYPEGDATFTEYPLLVSAVARMQEFFGAASQHLLPFSAVDGAYRFALWGLSSFELCEGQMASIAANLGPYRPGAQPPLGWKIEFTVDGPHAEQPEGPGKVEAGETRYTSGQQAEWPLRAILDILHHRPKTISEHDVLVRAEAHLRELFEVYERLSYVPRLFERVERQLIRT